jgi:hypothetical protein
MRLGHGWGIAMAMLDGAMAESSSYIPAIFGLAGSLIGGFIAGTVSLLVARQARAAAEGTWIRDNRREIYDRLLTRAERLLHACEAYQEAHGGKESVKANLESAYTNFFEAYGVLQTVAGIPLVDAARDHAYRLRALAESLTSTRVMDPQKFNLVVKLIREPRHEVLMDPQKFNLVVRLIREARHEVLDAMRAELGLDRGIRPAVDYNPWAGTNTELEEEYVPVERSRFGLWPIL